MFPLDIHTHRLPLHPGGAIVNCYPETFSPQAEGWYSVGIHPWQAGQIAGDDGLCAAVERLRSLLCHPQVLAVGEAGIDKLTDTPVEWQLRLFEQQARLAEEAGKPLIIHLVRAAEELLKLKRTLRPSVPWIIHGFRGKKELAREYMRHDLCLSFGEKYQEEAFRTVPEDCLFIETDESTVSLRELYARAARVRGVSPEALAETVRRNVRNLFFKP